MKGVNSEDMSTQKPAHFKAYCLSRDEFHNLPYKKTARQSLLALAGDVSTMSHRKPSPVQIRRFDSQDSTAVLQLANELIPKSEGPQRATMLKRVLQDPNYSLYVAEVDEHIAGFIDLRIFPDFVEGMPLALIQNVVVQKRFRQQGIGSQLL
jgi:hypothetical protein